LLGAVLIKPNILNLVLFQAGWWTSLFTAYNDTSLVLLFVLVAFLLCIHFRYIVPANRRNNELLFFVAFTVLGYLIDSVFAYFAVLDFTSTLGGFAPAWLIAMWLLFPMTIGYGFGWLQGKYVLAGFLGAIGGPLTYKVGASFDLVDIHGITNLLIYALYWALVFVISIYVYGKMVLKKESK